MGRSPCCDKTKVKRGSWSPGEDAALKDYIHKHGTAGKWIGLPQKAGLKRCGKSCRLRWLNYLRPDIKHGGFTQEEDKTIVNLYNKLGSRWSVIASHLPGRTDNDVKNYWNTKLKKRWLPAEFSSSPTIATTTAIAGNNVTFQGSMNSLEPVPPFLPNTTTIANDPNNSPIPRTICRDSDGQLDQNITSSYSQSHQDSGTSTPSTFVIDEYYGVKGIPVDGYSNEALSGLWSSMETIEADSDIADFAQLFPF